jgi:Ner family transcriptional regulator
MVNDWHPETIKAEVRKRGLTLRQLDKQYRLPVNTCAKSLYQPGPRGEKAISRILDLPAATLWPSRYDAKGRRLKPQPLCNYTRRSWRDAGGWAA